MARKQETLVTFNIRFDLPIGESVSNLSDKINEALKEWVHDYPILVKKETTYE